MPISIPSWGALLRRIKAIDGEGSGIDADTVDGLHATDLQGQTGPQGEAATISVGTTTTIAAGTDASVTNSGTTSAAVLDFAIPQGAKGDTGAAGSDGADGTSFFQASETSDPTANDDASNTSGNGTFDYGAGWINKTGGTLFICVDPTATAADWRQVFTADADGDFVGRIKVRSIDTGDTTTILAADELGVQDGTLYLGDGTTQPGVSTLPATVAKTDAANTWSETQTFAGNVAFDASGLVYIQTDASYTTTLQFGGANVSTITVNTSSAPGIKFHSSAFGFFNADPASQQSVAGTLSGVADSNAKDVLTSLIAALSAYGLITDSTT